MREAMQSSGSVGDIGRAHFTNAGVLKLSLFSQLNAYIT